MIWFINENPSARAEMVSHEMLAMETPEDPITNFACTSEQDGKTLLLKTLNAMNMNQEEFKLEYSGNPHPSHRLAFIVPEDTLQFAGEELLPTIQFNFAPRQKNIDMLNKTFLYMQ